MGRKRKKNGQFGRDFVKAKRPKADKNVVIDHTYIATHLCDSVDPEKPGCLSDSCVFVQPLTDAHGKEYTVPGPRGGWREGRRVIELGVLLDNLAVCPKCKLGPIPITRNNVVGELQKGLSGYLYLRLEHTHRSPHPASSYNIHHTQPTPIPSDKQLEQTPPPPCPANTLTPPGAQL